MVAALVDHLRALITGDTGLSLVAEDRGEVVGHVMFSASRLDASRRLVDVQVLSPLAGCPAGSDAESARRSSARDSRSSPAGPCPSSSSTHSA